MVEWQEWWKLPSSQLCAASLQGNDRRQSSTPTHTRTHTYTEGIFILMFQIVSWALGQTRNLCRFMIPMVNSTYQPGMTGQKMFVKIFSRILQGLLLQLHPSHISMPCVCMQSKHYKECKIHLFVHSFKSTQHLLSAFPPRSFSPRTYPIARVTRLSLYQNVQYNTVLGK